MPRSSVRRTALLLAGLAALACNSVALADGEAALVLQDGDTVTTYCVAFDGDGITGDALLRAAGQEFDAFGGGSGLAVCSIGARGCKDASSFSSCFCECEGSSCDYWAFFTRAFGKDWVYSTLAFNLLKAKDGDVHGWKWGRGAANSAPAPQDVTFEQVCGHAPRGGAIPATQPPPPPPPPLAATASATATAPLTTLATSTAVAATQAAASPSPTLVTLTAAATVPNTPAGGPEAPSVGADGSDEDGSGTGAIIAFGATAAVLLAALAGGLLWRSRHAS